MANRSTPSSARSEAIARSWATRKANAALESEWILKPVCICGCGEALTRHRNPQRQRLFRPGHDARLKAVAAGVLARECPEQMVPQIARVLKNRIGFLRTRPDLAKAF